MNQIEASAIRSRGVEGREKKRGTIDAINREEGESGARFSGSETRREDRPDRRRARGGEARTWAPFIAGAEAVEWPGASGILTGHGVALAWALG
jgi:hypothetical protein